MNDNNKLVFRIAIIISGRRRRCPRGTGNQHSNIESRFLWLHILLSMQSNLAINSCLFAIICTSNNWFTYFYCWFPIADIGWDCINPFDTPPEYCGNVTTYCSYYECGYQCEGNIWFLSLTDHEKEVLYKSYSMWEKKLRRFVSLIIPRTLYKFSSNLVSR